MTALLNKAATKIFGSANERLLKRLWPIVSEINALEAEMKGLSDDQLREKTTKSREYVETRMANAELTGGTADEEKNALRAALDEALDEYRKALRMPDVPKRAMIDYARLLLVRNVQRGQSDWAAVNDAVPRLRWRLTSGSFAAVTSGIPKMATFTFRLVSDMAEMAGLLRLRL